MRKLDVRMPGIFLNPGIGDGFELLDKKIEDGILGMQVTTYLLELNKDHPFLWVMKDGTRVMPANRVRTDFASIPNFFQKWIPKDRFVGAFFHDDGYVTGGFWVKFPGESKWVWVEVGLADQNTFLKTLCQHDPNPCGKAKPWLMWTGVSLGGWAPWCMRRWRNRVHPHTDDPNLWDEKVYGAED